MDASVNNIPVDLHHIQVEINNNHENNEVEELDLSQESHNTQQQEEEIEQNQPENIIPIVYPPEAFQPDPHIL